MHDNAPSFAPPATPAAKCFTLIRRNPLITRGELQQMTELSQPTITRAAMSLLEAGLITQRTELTRSRGRGRPTVPLEVAENDWALAGIAVGAVRTYLALYDTKGRTLRETELSMKLGHPDFVEHVMARLNQILVGTERHLVAISCTTPPGCDLSELRHQFRVPFYTSSAAAAVLAAELGTTLQPSATLVVYGEDAVHAAVSTGEAGVRAIDATAELTHMGIFSARLIEHFRPSTVVLAGPTFSAEPAVARRFARHLRRTCSHPAQLRLIPTPEDALRAMARAAALDPLQRCPLELGKVAQAA